ncbi:hypothetical protein [Actinomadura atramentaria]|uniref:hypothetical protein n=1 Tax=Actinomadura atramentaria TaxID=1990 RepID=UPI0003826E4C|nr:hypothetical protein [Actinomadura atramentaria]
MIFNTVDSWQTPIGRVHTVETGIGYAVQVPGETTQAGPFRTRQQAKRHAEDVVYVLRGCGPLPIPEGVEVPKEWDV